MREYLFRGFHPDENGSKTITLMGQKIKGEWIYWDCFGCSAKQFVRSVRHKNVPADYIFPSGIIHETVGQYTGHTDASQTKIFDGDRVILNEDFDEMYTVEWDNDKACFVIEGLCISYDFDCVRNDEIEVIGTKWQEVE